VEITEYLARHHIKCTQPTPYEHGQNGDVEILIKHNQETVYKLLDAAQLEEAYWGLALLHTTDIRELLPSASDPTISRGVAWGHSKTSLNISPLLPFGSRVLAHLPLKMQTALSGRAFPTIFVGRAPGVKGAVKLFNLATKRIILRRTFKVIGPVTIPTILTNINIEVSGEEGIDQLFYDPLTNSTRDLSSSDENVPNPGVPEPISKKKKKTGSITYRSILRSEVPKLQRFYFSKIGMQFLDIVTEENLKIIDIVRCTSSSGAGSKNFILKCMI